MTPTPTLKGCPTLVHARTSTLSHLTSPTLTTHTARDHSLCLNFCAAISVLSKEAISAFSVALTVAYFCAASDKEAISAFSCGCSAACVSCAAAHADSAQDTYKYEGAGQACVAVENHLCEREREKERVGGTQLMAGLALMQTCKEAHESV
eukprot:1144307-Pelagomonas_calceolata.AAC.7